MKLQKKFGAISLILLSMLFVSCGACAGEPVSPVPPIVSRELSDEKKSEDKFVFDAGERRDPFTFTKIAPSREDERSLSGDPLNLDKKQLRPHEVESKKKQADDLYADAERAFMATDPAFVIATCDRGLEIFKDIANLWDYPSLQIVRDNLMRLRKAAERMKQRQNAEREFGRLNIKITGVVARDKRSQAIINGVLVGKGAPIAASGDSNDTVVVDEILPEQVVFLFRGYKMILFLPEIGK